MASNTFEQKRRQTTAKLAALMLANAFIFQEQLSAIASKVRPIRGMVNSPDFVQVVADHWTMIIEEINYVPIFRVARDILLALPADADTDQAIRNLARRALDIVSKRAALRHDLMGRIYHYLLLEAKYLGTYYTSVPAATLLMKLALDPSDWKVDWSDLDQVKSMKVADLACGTGTLLMAASQAITDNVLKYRVRDGINAAFLRDLHKLIVEDILHGYDVLPSAVHLTASTLALLAPETCFEKMRLYSLPMGRAQSGQIYLGSIDYISADTVQTQLSLMSPGSIEGPEHIEKSDYGSVAPLPELDLCVMNPPFVRSVGGNLLFGSIPDQRSQMQTELAKRLKTSKLSASSTAGLGSVFTAIADRHIKPGGRIALVLPAAAATGISWEKTRDLIASRYILETIVMSHDPARWNFSENTDLSEVLIVARKHQSDESAAGTAQHEARFVNLWKNPKSSADALALGEVIKRVAAAPIGSSTSPTHGIADLIVGDKKYGEAISIPWSAIRKQPWIGCAFARTELMRAAWLIREGAFYQPGVSTCRALPIRRLGDIAELGPDRRDIADGFTTTAHRTSFPVFWGHDSENVTSIQSSPNKWLSPRNVPAKGRPTRDVDVLWSRAGSIMIAERSWLITQRTLAVRLPDPALSNVWWPVRLKKANVMSEKVLALWLNSTLGILTMLSCRVPTRGSWIQFKKPTIENLPVLDVSALSSQQRKQLASVYDIVCGEELLPLSQLASDDVRANIDSALSRILELPSLASLRLLLSEEPAMSGKPIEVEISPENYTDVLQLELL